jgi:Family of unknown function (DUF5808)
MNAKLPPGTLEKLWNDPTSWRGLGTYYCKADPRVIVPKRIRWTGWTMNFAHAAAWWYLIVGLLLAIAVICVGAASGRQWLLVGTVAVIVLSIVLGIVLSSPLRFEERD